MYNFLRFPGFKYKALTLSYDDDVIFDKKLIEILDEYKIKCTFNLNSLLFKNEKNNTPNYLTKEEATLLFKDSLHEVAVHGAKHLSLAEVKSEIALKDVLTDRENLEKQLDRVIKGMAYANGSFNDEVVELLKNAESNTLELVLIITTLKYLLIG